MSTAVTAFWISFAFIALVFWVEGVNRITDCLFDLQNEIRMQTAQQTYLIEGKRASDE